MSTNWQDPKSSEIRSTQISGLQEAVSKIEKSIDLDLLYETMIPLSEVFISNDDRYRIYQAPEGKRNWLSSPTPVIKKNGLVITDDFEIDYGGGAIIFTTSLAASAYITAGVSYTQEIYGKQLSTNDFTNEEKLKNQNNKDDIINLSETVGDTTIDDTLVPNSDTGLSVQTLLSWLGNMIKSITGKSSWRIKPTKNLEELNTALTTHEAETANKAHGGFKGALLFANTMQSIPDNVETKLVFSNVAYGNIFFNTSNPTRITIPANVNKVKLISKVHFDIKSEGNRFIVLSKNGSTIGLQGYFGKVAMNVRASENVPGKIPNSNVTQLLLTSPVLNVIEGDYFEIVVGQTSGNALYAGGGVGSGNNNWVAIEVIE